MRWSEPERAPCHFGLEVCSHTTLAFARGIAAPPEGWPARIATHADSIGYLFEVVRATAPAAEQEHARDLLLSLRTGARPVAAIQPAEVAPSRPGAARSRTPARRPVPVPLD